MRPFSKVETGRGCCSRARRGASYELCLVSGACRGANRSMKYRPKTGFSDFAAILASEVLRSMTWNIYHSIELVELHLMSYVSWVAHVVERILQWNTGQKPGFQFSRQSGYTSFAFNELTYIPFDRTLRAASNKVGLMSGACRGANCQMKYRSKTRFLGFLGL